MKYVTLGPDGKGYCLPFIHNWAILNVKPVGENATEATEHLTAKQHRILPTPSQPAERNMCYVVYRSARRKCTSTGFAFRSAIFKKNNKNPNQKTCGSLSSCRLLPLQGSLGGKKVPSSGLAIWKSCACPPEISWEGISCYVWEKPC